MKTLVESIFDDDLISKNPDTYQLKKDFIFDGQIVFRSRRVPIVGEFTEKPNYLGAIDWRFLKKELRKLHAEHFDLGRYSYYNGGQNNDRSKDSITKTEMMARYILNIPMYNKWDKLGFNSRVRDELEDKLNRFIDNLDLYNFEVRNSLSCMRINLYAKTQIDSWVVASWEFEYRDN